MKKKTFILTFLMMLCPLVFGQGCPWTQPSNYENTMTVSGRVLIQGECVKNEAASRYTLGAFCGEQLRGVVPVSKFNSGTQITIGGENGQSITFKLWDGEALSELEYSSDPVKFVTNDIITMFDINFIGKNHWNPSHNTSGNMTVTAHVTIDGADVDGDYEIGAFIGDEVCGSARVSNSLAFILISHNENGNDAKVTFKLWNHDANPAGLAEEITDVTIDYADDANYGSETPFVINFNNPVAQVGGKNFATLQAAVNATTAANSEVIVLRDFVLDNAVAIANDQTVVLNLGGHTVTAIPTETKAFAAITNRGNLTISNGTLLCDHTLAGSTAYAVNTIVNSGTLTINGATIENKSTASNQIGYAIDNNSTSADAILVVESGEVVASGSNYYDGIRQFCNSETKENSVTIEGGEVSSLWMQNPSDGATERNAKDVKGSFSIEGGSLNALYLEPSANFIGKITGGHVAVISRFETAEGRDIVKFIKGGTFGMDVTEFCAEGYICRDKGNGTYIVIKDPVAKVGNTEYGDIDEAIANWTNGTTLTLLKDVTLSDVIQLKSTEHHILNLGVYTMTAASGKDAIEITCEGRSSASYAITVNADADNPGGITATGKSCIYYKKSGSTKDRPIILINNGVFTGSYSLNLTSNGNTNCPQIWINGGVFNSYMNLTKCMLRVSGGVFHAAINCTGDSSAYREIKGGRFKSWQFMTADAPTKFWVGSGNGNYNVGVYVDSEGYLVVGGDVITEAGDRFVASSTNYSGWSSYLKYSSAATSGLYYTSYKEAFDDNNKTTGVVTVYVKQLDLRGVLYKGTIKLPENIIELTVQFKEGVNTEWNVATSIEGKIAVVDTEVISNGDVTRTYKVVTPVAQIGTTKYETLASAVTAATNDQTIELLWAEGDAPIAMNASLFGKNVTITGTATVDWSKGFLFVGRGGEGNATLTFNNAKLTSASNSASYGIHVSGREKNTNNKYDGTVEIKNSTIVLDYLINKGVMTMDNSILTVKNGFSVGGRPASETESGVDATATIALTNASKLVVNNHNGMGLGYEAIGVMDIDGTSSFETTQKFLVTAKGTMNIAGTAKIAGDLTNNGTITLTAKAATLEAQEGLNIVTTVENSLVSYQDGKYQVADAAAKIGDVYYTTFDEAYNAAKKGDVVELLRTAVIKNFKPWINYSKKQITVKAAFGDVAFRVQDGAYVWFGGMTIESDDYCIIVGASDGSSGADVQIYGGTYNGVTSAVSVTKGSVKIMDGTFKVEPYEDSYEYTINCIDANYVNGSAEVAIQGGKFYNFNPENNAAEGAGTNFLVANYAAYKDTENYYNVIEGLIGKGTEEEPFLIRNLKELKFFRDHVNAGKTKYNAEGVYVALAANIDMASVDWSVNIGDDCNYTFDGIFDGKGFTLSNLNSLETAQKADGYICTGLFGAIYGNATVKNLTIENVSISTAEYTGNNVSAVVGFAYNATGSIENVKVIGNININAPEATGVGAIVGYDYYSPSLKIENCSVIGNNGSAIVAKSYVGGLVGYASSKIALNGNTVENVSVTGTASVGAIAGIMLGGSSANANIVKNVNLSTTGELWANSAAVVAGTITGGGVTVENTTVENVIANGTAASIVGGVLVEKPTTPIAKVPARNENVYYTTHEAALSAEGSNVTFFVPYTVEAGEELTIDKNVTYTSDVMGEAMITNKGTLTINGTVAYTYTGAADSSYGKGNYTINNSGTLTVNGNVENNTAKMSHASYAINTNAGATLNVEEDGKVLNLTGHAIRMVSFGTAANNVNINGGYVEGTRALQVQLPGSATSATKPEMNLAISGGELKSNEETYNLAVYVYSNGQSAENLNIDIAGGTFNGNVAINAAATETMQEGSVKVQGGTFNGQWGVFSYAEDTENTIAITGGTFKTNYSEMYAENDGYIFVLNEEGTYTVTSGEYVAEIGGVRYATLQAAVDACVAGETIVLLANVETTNVTLPENVTLDLNDKTVKADIIGTVKTNGGLWITSTGHKMLGSGADIYATENATVINSANEVNIVSGAITLAATEWWTLQGQNLTIAENATFTIPATSKFNVMNGTTVTVKGAAINDGTLVIYGTAIVNGTITVNGTVELAALEATLKAQEGLNVITNIEDKAVAYENGMYKVVQAIYEQVQTLAKGWNWYSSYINISGEEGLKTLENALGYNATTIKNNGGFVEFVDIDQWYGNGKFTSVSVEEMYMINVTDNTDIQIRGNLADPTTEITIRKGWNWIGYPVSESVNFEDALEDLVNKAQNGDRIKSRNNGYLEFISNNNFTGWDGGMESFVPGQGYMYYSNSETPITFTYTVPASKAEARANVTADNNHWVPSSADYANNMTVTAVLNIDGNMMKEGFEVAAFANGEVRGSARPVFVEAIGQYVMFMTIYGEGGEELTFKCYDIYSDEEYTLGDRMVYADDAMIGSVGNPYMLTLNTMGIGENGYSTISLYPNPTTTNAAISFEATCDMVEVFNSLGVRVAEYRNVDSIDGMEAAGVYVIRVTNGETVQNCRLIVK